MCVDGADGLTGTDRVAALVQVRATYSVTACSVCRVMMVIGQEVISCFPRYSLNNSRRLASCREGRALR